jgi:hypothetical protein
MIHMYVPAIFIVEVRILLRVLSNYKIKLSFATTNKTYFISCSLRSLHVSAFTRGHLQVITCKHKKKNIKVTLRYNGSYNSTQRIRCNVILDFFFFFTSNQLKMASCEGRNM